MFNIKLELGLDVNVKLELGLDIYLLSWNQILTFNVRLEPIIDV